MVQVLSIFKADFRKFLYIASVLDMMGNIKTKFMFVILN